MLYPRRFLLLWLFIANMVCAGAAHAQWRSDSVTNTAIIKHKGSQDRPQIASDGKNGAIIVWEDTRQNSNGDIYAQRLSSEGTLLWRTGGVPICTSYYDQANPKIAADGNGGAWIVWEDRRNGSMGIDLYAQHIDANGMTSYLDNGIGIAVAERDQSNAVLCFNGDDKLFVAWEDDRPASSTVRPDIWFNALTFDTSLHHESGIEIVGAMGLQQEIAMIPDGQSGAVIAWENYKGSPSTIQASRVTSSGTLLWNGGGQNPGTQVYKGISSQNNCGSPSLARDGNEFLIAFDVQNTRSTLVRDIYANKLTWDGEILWHSGIEVSGEWPGDQSQPQVFSDDSGGFFVVFEHYSGDISPYFYNRDVVAVRVLPNGVVRRPPFLDGFFDICHQKYGQVNSTVLKSGAQYFTVWDDARAGNSDTSVYAQVLDRNFDRYLPTFQTRSSWGQAVANKSGVVQKHAAACLRTDGMIAVWTDKRNGDWDIYAQVLFKDGTLPIELASFDVRESTPGMVDLSWTTYAEDANAGFEIERRDVGESVDAFSVIESYQTSSKLVGAGTSNTTRHYASTDMPGEGMYEYRIVDVDLNGVRTVHPFTSVRVGSTEKTFTVAPPARNAWDDLSMTISSPLSDRYQIEIYNTLGIRVYNLEKPLAAGVRGVRLPRDLALGTYFIVVSNSNDAKRMKFVK